MYYSFAYLCLPQPSEEHPCIEVASECEYPFLLGVSYAEQMAPISVSSHSSSSAVSWAMLVPIFCFASQVEVP